MMPIQSTRQDGHRHPADLTDLDFYRRRANEIRAQGMRDTVTLKSVCIGVLLAVVFPVLSAVVADSIRALNRHAAAAQTDVAQTNVAQAR